MSDTARAGEMLRNAAVIVDSSRTNGEKERSFAAIGRMWTAFIFNRKNPNAPLTPANVAAMMALLKLMRSEHGIHVEDHAIDGAGYLAIWGELREAEPVAVQPASAA